MKAPLHHATESLADFWGDGVSSDSSEKKEKQSTKTVSDLLTWISKVTIKRRKFRRQYRCSNLRAEAVLSNTLRQAKLELAEKQEEKRKKAQEFSYQLNIKLSQANSHQDNEMDSSDESSQTFHIVNSDQSCKKDEHVQACISSLDNFFSELKAIKV